MEGVRKKVSGSAEIGHQGLILKNILEGLPLKKIIEGRCVSKQFKSITEESQFKPACFKVDGLVLSDKSVSKSCIPLSARYPQPKYFQKFEFEVLQAVNGLFLCRDVTAYGAELYILNPGEWSRHFPPSVNAARGDNVNARQSKYKLELSTSLVFNPLVSSTKFQLFSIWCNKNNDLDCAYRIEAYDSKKETWRLCYNNASPVHHLQDPRNRAILNNSGVYWSNSLNWCGTDGAVIYLNIEKTELMSVVPPNATDPNYHQDYFDECCGHLLLTRVSKSEVAFQVYEMCVGHTMWNFKWKVDLHGPSPSISYSRSNFRIILAQIGDLETMYVIVQESKVFILLHGHGKRRIKELQEELRCEEDFKAFKYIHPPPGSCFLYPV